jgi:hypothetical protein
MFSPRDFSPAAFRQATILKIMYAIALPSSERLGTWGEAVG